MTTYFDNRPNKLEPFGKSSYLYVFNIEECISPLANGDIIHNWKADTVKVYAPLNSDRILKAVIEEYYGQDRELKLINDYNSIMAGIALEEDKDIVVNRYQDFLAKRIALKKQVEEDCKELSIE